MPKNKKILLVEDDELIREMYRIKFVASGIKVDIAKDGKEALIKAMRNKPDLLLLDIKMPTINGDEVLEKIQRFEWAKKMKVIIMTNISFDEAPKNLKKLRFDKYIVKAHYTPAKIIKAVRDTLAESD